MARITINLSDKEKELKDMIRDLKDKDTNGNPYFDRSESVIAKMILQPALKKAHGKFVKRKK